MHVLRRVTTSAAARPTPAHIRRLATATEQAQVPPTTAELHRAALAAAKGHRPEQAKANATDSAADSSRRADIDRSRYGSTRADVATTEAGEDISAGRSRTYVREEGIAEQTSTTLPEILRMDLHRRQNLPLLRSEVRVKRTVRPQRNVYHSGDCSALFLTDCL